MKYDQSTAMKINAQRIEEAKAAASMTEEVDTWHGWKDRGFQVRSSVAALFWTDLIWAAEGENYTIGFYGLSQVCRPVTG